MGGAVFSPCFLTWDQTMVEVMKIMVTSSKALMHTLPYSVPLTLLQATGDPGLQWRLLDSHRQVWISLLCCHCSFLLGPCVHKLLFEPSGLLWWVWSLIVNVILPLLLSCWDFSFALACGVSFFGGIQHSLVNGRSAVTCSFGILTGECVSFYSAILKVTP